MKYYIKGNVRKILYENTGGYKVGLFKIKETNDESVSEYVNKTMTFTGVFMPLNNEQTYTFYGKLVNHARFGMQYNVESYEITTPSDNEGLIMYLSSDIFKGIGPSIAKAIVDMFGSESINEIKNANSRILNIKGMNVRKFENLIKTLNENTKDQDLILELNEIGFNSKESMTLITKYKDKVKEIINSNIYLLNNDVDFTKLDSIFLKSNDEFDELRVKALIKYLIKMICYENGDTMVDKEKLYVSINPYFSEVLSIEVFINYLEELEVSNEIIIVENSLMLIEYYETEMFIADRIKVLNRKSVFNEKNIDKLISEFESVNSLVLNDEQISAIRGSILNNFFIVTGGPGTGKTTIIKAIVELYKKLMGTSYKSGDITLLAPTGRSAKRMAESIGETASTIHKFLKWNKEDESFQVNMFNPSDTKFVIIDEVSMVDVFLMKSLLLGLKDNIKLVLVGDANQLPSIGPGNILYDLLSVDVVKRVELNKIYRTKEGSYIIDFARDIKDKREYVNDGKKYSDFSFIEVNSESVKSMVKVISEKALSKGIDASNLQLLAPMYKGENGIDALNAVMQGIFNPPSNNKSELVIRDVTYRVGDKVLQLVNDVDNNVYNGDVGIIKEIFTGKKPMVIVDYSGIKVSYNKGKFDEFTHAFAISIHKSQGSEYEHVIMVITKGFKRMLYNKLIYTGVTRAKKSLVIIGEVDSLNYGIKKEYALYRKTMLSNFF